MGVSPRAQHAKALSKARKKLTAGKLRAPPKDTAPVAAGTAREPSWVHVHRPTATANVAAMGTGNGHTIIQGRTTKKWRKPVHEVLSAAKKAAGGLETCVAFAVNPRFGAVFFNSYVLDDNGKARPVNFPELMKRVCKRTACKKPHDVDDAQWSMYVKATFLDRLVGWRVKHVHSTPGLPTGITHKQMKHTSKESSREADRLHRQSGHDKRDAARQFKKAALLKAQAKRLARQARRAMKGAVKAATTAQHTLGGQRPLDARPSIQLKH